MSNNIGFCGYDCSKCAARSEDAALRQRLVDAWRRILGHTAYTVENVYCAGCRNEGPHADTSCQARPCAIAKGIESCGECDEFPCRKVGQLISNREALIMYCHRQIKDATEEEFELATAQFTCSQGNIIKAMQAKGKLPEWL